MRLKKKKILCFVNFYLPGHKSGGPVQSIANFVNQLGHVYDINIVCCDHDAQEPLSYKDIKINTWNNVGKAKVFYASKKYLTFLGIKKLLIETSYDLLYLNSFFSFRFTLLPLLVRFFGISAEKPCLIAPRGEFSLGALEIKFIKKKIYIFIVSFFGFYKNLYWQASSNYEKKDILSNFTNKKKKIFVAPNLTQEIKINKKNLLRRIEGSLRLIFFSRISPKKNLDFLLLSLLKVKVPIILDIYGVNSDEKYYKYCVNLINKLPSNIKVKIKQNVSHKKILKILSNYDLFAFPTKGENFGHVIYESLSVGTPVLVSDKTPWQPGIEGSLQVLKLQKDKWAKFITNWSKLDTKKLIRNRHKAIKYIKNYNIKNLSLKKNKKLFISILNISDI